MQIIIRVPRIAVRIAVSIGLLIPLMASATEPDHERGFWQMIEELSSYTENMIESDVSLVDVTRILGRSCEFSLVTADLSADLLEEAKYWEKNYGLELRGGITTDDLKSERADEQGATYLELSWDVLASGYKEYDYRAKEFRRRAALEKVRSELAATAEEYRCRAYQIDSAFDTIEARLGRQKLQLMEAVYSVEKRAYFNGDSSMNEYLISEESLARLRSRLKFLANAPQHGKQSYNSEVPPAIDLDIDSLLDEVRNDPRHTQLSALQQQGILNSNPYRDGNRLRLFLRQEFDLLDSDRDDLIAGLRFSVPWSFGDRPSYQGRLQQLQQEGQMTSWERVVRTQEAYRSFVDQSERVMTQQYRYLRARERIRKLMGRRVSGDELLLSAAVARVHTYIDAALELVDTNRELYSLANRVFLVARVPYRTEFVQLNSLSLNNYRAREFQRSVYLWSETFNTYDNNQLMLLLKTKSFSRVILSASSKAHMTKLEDFLQRADEEGIDVELMVAENSWVNPDKHAGATARVAALAALADNLHLDVEPQALDNYQENRQAYQDHYLILIRKIREQSPDLNLSLSVPFHWEPETYRALASLVDRLYVMNYANRDIDVLVRRMKRILLEVPLSKVAMAVRPEDFSSPYQLEEILAAMHSATGINQFAIHKLASITADLGYRP